ncbi:hypothetical protein AMAG_07284 [Allomyces macrogynus ATCC 38327]|uniref:Lanthionine synthetase C family protein n=1 Tax=Allomyces macrogynus (strain ATCC 38327) TaxID=578462 RepID=A0A0L0SHV4_ALLM3|nr:hypothetical protein AMAG_07284 [Allomyces macrogynus ATCC 38327]|eukprot:KNE62027.1 hypothetical protein AMAG_07284 [Allomyces macrogynus ATCC 38327]
MIPNHHDDPTTDPAHDASAESTDDKLNAPQLAKLAWEYARSVGIVTDLTEPEPQLRYRANPFVVNEYGPGAADALSLSQILTASYPEHGASLFHALVARVVDGDADDDAPIYMGHAGAAWLLFKIHCVDPGFALGSRSALAIAHDLAERAHAAALVTIERSRDDDYVSSSPFPSGVGFLCTPVGALAIAAVVRHHYDQSSVKFGGHGDEAGGAVTDILAELHAFIQRHAFSPDCPSEVLFGRSGLVAALQLVARHIPETRDSEHAYGRALPVTDLLLRLVEAIIEDGRNGAVALAQTHPDAPQLTLAWSTLGKWYLGAAHGAAGILTVLLALSNDLTAPYLEEIKQTVCDLAQLAEFPTTIDKLCAPDTPAKDPANVMVQWCHGAVGLGLLFVRAFAKFGDAEFLARATLCGELAWEQGIVDKHVGLCHGVAGNAYLFLSMWRATRLRLWYQRTLAFALTAPHWQGGLCDHPASVWEGWGGLASLLADLLVAPEPVVDHDPEEAQSAQSSYLETEATDLIARTAHARVLLAVETVRSAGFQGFPCVDDC